MTSEEIRASSVFACELADRASAEQARSYVAWERRVTDQEGYLVDWQGAPCTWEPYAELEYLGVNADPEKVNRCGVEERVIYVYPEKLPENAHWKGWVW